MEFYLAGRILNEHDGSRLYDFELQEDLYVELSPGETWLRLPFLYPPFIAFLFRPFALLPLFPALLGFLVITPMLFLWGLWSLVSTFGPTTRDQRALVLVGALSFFPFLVYSWLGAQISVIGFCAVAATLVLEERGHPFRSGMALSVALYKPSLLVLILPMLMFTGRFRQLGGFVTGGLLLALLSLSIAGIGGSMGFIENLAAMSRLTTQDAGLFNAYRYVDLFAFVRLLPHGSSAVATIIVALIGVCGAVVLVRCWLRYREANRPEQRLVWAATLMWGLVLNTYTPLYDCIVIVAAGILAVAALDPIRRHVPQTLFWILLGVLYFVPWFAEVFAREFSVQLYTLTIAAFGSLLLYALQMTRRDREHAALATVTG